QWQKAVEPLQRAVALGNSDGDTFLKLGTAYQYAEDRTRALEYFTKALERGCDAALLKRGRLYYLMGKPDLAIEDLDYAIEHQVDIAKAYLERGAIHYELKDINRALADYTNAIEADPKSSRAYGARAQLLNDTVGDFRGAIDDFNRAIEL